MMFIYIQCMCHCDMCVRCEPIQSSQRSCSSHAEGAEPEMDTGLIDEAAGLGEEAVFAARAIGVNADSAFTPN